MSGTTGYGTLAVHSRDCSDRPIQLLLDILLDHYLVRY